MEREIQAIYGSKLSATHAQEWVSRKGLHPPCCLCYPELQLSCVVHGDDFTCLGIDSSLDVFEKNMTKHFDCKLKGRLGVEPGDQKSMRVLNRIVTITENGLEYEPDPRHAELLVRDHGLTFSDKHSVVPGQKETYDEARHMPENSIDDIMSSIRALIHTTIWSFRTAYHR